MTKLLEPTFNRVVVRPLKPSEVPDHYEVEDNGVMRSSGILIPEGSKRKAASNEGRVIAVGPKCVQVKAGDLVKYTELGAVQTALGGSGAIIIYETDIAAIYREAPEE